VTWLFAASNRPATILTNPISEIGESQTVERNGMTKLTGGCAISSNYLMQN